MKPAGLLLPPTLYPERRRPGEPRASPAPFGPDRARVVLLAVTASWGSRWAKLRGRKDPQGGPGCLPSAVFPLHHLSLLGLL